MMKPKMTYFENEDILCLVITEEDEANSVELSRNITVELSENGEVIGIEIVNATVYIGNSTREVIQANLPNLNRAEK